MLLDTVHVEHGITLLISMPYPRPAPIGRYLKILGEPFFGQPAIKATAPPCCGVVHPAKTPSMNVIAEAIKDRTSHEALASKSPIGMVKVSPMFTALLATN